MFRRFCLHFEHVEQKMLNIFENYVKIDVRINRGELI